MGLERLRDMGLEQVSDDSGRLRIPKQRAEVASKQRNSGTHLLIDFGFRQGETGGFYLTPSVTELTILPDEQAVRVNQRQVSLTPREYTLLDFISEREGVSVPHEVVLEKAFKSKSKNKGSVRTQTYFIRRFLGDELASSAIKNSQGSIRFGEFDPTRYYDENSGEIVESQRMEVFPEKLILYPESGGVQIYDSVVELKPQEADLMALFATRVNSTIPQETIHEFLRPGKIFSPADVHKWVNNLRIKIDPDPQNPSMIQAVPGKGFKLTDPDSSQGLVKNKTILLDDNTVVIEGVNVSLIDIDRKFLNLLRDCENGFATQEVLTASGLSEGYARTMVWRLRRILGKDTIVRIKGGGYRLRVEKFKQ